MQIINISPIFKEHFETLKDDTSLFWILILFFIIPLIISAILVLFGVKITPASVNAVIASFSIFIGFSINVLIFLIGGLPEDDKDGSMLHLRKKLIEHLYKNTSFVIVLGIIILSLALISNFIIPYINNISILLLSFFLYFLLIIFILTLLMITKRLYALHAKELE